MIKQNLLTGSGIGSFSKIYPSFRPPQYFLFPDAAPMTLHSHNELLEIFAELGIIGLLLNLCFMISIFIFTLKGINKIENNFKRLLIQGLLSGTLGLLIQNLFSVSLRIPFITFYLWLGLGISAGIIKNRDSGFLNLNLENKFKRSILLFLFPGLIIWVSIKFILFPFLGDFHFKKGYLERGKGNSAQAIGYYSKALNFSPTRVDIYYSRAFILNKIGKEREALENYLKIEKLSPGYGKIYLNLGITYLSLDEFDKAIEVLKKAISVNPYDSHAHNSLSMALNSQAQIDRIEKDL